MVFTLSEVYNISLEEFLNNSSRDNDIDIKDIKIEKFSSKLNFHKKEINTLEKEMDKFSDVSSIEELLKGPHYVFMNGNNLVGYVIINKGSDTCYISSYIIKSEYRGKGLGKDCFKLLLGFIKNKFKPKEIGLWVHTDNDPARNIYYSFGFKSTDILLEGDVTKNKDSIAETTTNKKLIDELLDMYKTDLSDVSKEYLPDKSALVLIEDNKVSAGCSYNTYKEGNDKYLTLFYPVGRDENSLKIFLDNAINRCKLDVNKFHMQHKLSYKLYNTVSKFGKPEQERLILKI